MNHAHSWGDPTPLTTTPAVVALWERWGDPTALLNVLHKVPTWGHLAAMSATDRVHLVGPVLASVPLPAACPPLPELPGGARGITPYDGQYPRGVPAVRWPVLYSTGTLPFGYAVLVAGGETPSPQAVEIARSAALAAAVEQVPVVAVLAPGASMVALRTAVDAGAVAVAVVPHGLDLTSTHQGLLDQIRRGGGAAVSASRPGTPASSEAFNEAAYLAAALCRAAVIAEVGAPPSAAATITRAVISAERFLIVPTPPPHHVPAGALGLTALTQHAMFSSDWYGTSHRIAARVKAELTPADAVVTSQAQISAAVRSFCRPPAPGDVTAEG